MTCQLLQALLIEVRALRRAVEKTEMVPPSIEFEELLRSIWAFAREREWTCASLIREVRRNPDSDALTLMARLNELRMADAHALGTYFRSRVGVASNGFELRRLGLGVNHVARWAVLAPQEVQSSPAALYQDAGQQLQLHKDDRGSLP